MKKSLLFIFALAVGFSAAFSQSVTSLAIIPSPSAPSDDLMLVAVTAYPGGPCSFVNAYANVQSGNTITVKPIFCFESGSGGCSSTNTFSIGQLPAGNYTISFELISTNSAGPCGSLTYQLKAIQQLQFTVGGTTGMEGKASETVMIFPNPAKDVVTFSLTGKEQADSEIKIYNSSGAVVKTLPANGEANKEIDLSNLSDGIYFYTIKTKEQLLSGKLVVAD